MAINSITIAVLSKKPNCKRNEYPNMGYFNLGPMIPFFFLSLLYGVVIYSVFIFIFGQANTVADGLAFCFAWIFTIGLVLSSVEALLNSKTMAVSLDSEMGIIYWPLSNLTTLFEMKIEPYNDYPSTYKQELLKASYWFAIWGVLGIAAAFGYVKAFVKKGAQKAGEISDSWFGYKTLIPMFIAKNANAAK